MIHETTNMEKLKLEKQIIHNRCIQPIINHWSSKYLFVGSTSNGVCLNSNRRVSVIKQYTLRQHYKKQH
jgi:hypothetical protein